MFTACAPTNQSSPSLISKSSKTDNSITISASSPSSLEERGYTIVVPANVRFRGVDMQLDLKIDQKTLAAASDISKAVEEAVQSRSRRATTMAVAPAEPPTVATTSSSTSSSSHSIDSSTSLGEVIDAQQESPLTAQQTLQTPGAFASTSSGGGGELPTQSSDSIAQPCTSTTVSSPSGSNGSHHDHTTIPCSSSSSQQQNLSQQQQSAPHQNNHDLAASNTTTPLHESTPNPDGDVAPQQKATKKRRPKDQTQSVFCCFSDDNAKVCKQRAILKYQYCIRHILLDVTAPYKRCQHERKPKSKKDPPVKCTNAIQIGKKEDYCSTHLIMMGKKEPKKKSSKEDKENGLAKAESTTTLETVDSPACPTPSTGEIYPPTHDPYADHMFDGENSCSSTTNSMQWQPSSVPPSQPSQHQNVVLQQQQPQRYDMQPMSVDNNGYPHQSPMPYDSAVTVGEFVNSQMAKAQMQQQQQQVLHPPQPPPQPPPPQQQQQILHHQRPPPIPTPQHQVPYDQHVHPQQMQPPSTPNKITSPLQVGTIPNGSGPPQSPFHSPYPPTPMPPINSNETVGHYVQRQLQPMLQQQQQQMQPQPQMQHPQMQQQRQAHYPQQQQQYPQQAGLNQPAPQQQVQIQHQHQQQPHQHHQFVQPAPPQHSRRQNVAVQQQQQQQQQQKPQVVVNRTPTVSSLLSRPQNSHQIPQQLQQQAPTQRQYQRIVVQGPPPSGMQKMMVAAVPQTTNVLPWNAPNHIVLEKPQKMDPKTKMPRYTVEEAEKSLKPEEEDDSFLDAYLQSDEKRPPKKKMILKPKRYRMKMIGSYRNVPSVDHMCKLFEDSDFDKTDLFPLGLEPSDDEDSYSDDDFFNISGDWCRRMAHDGGSVPSTSNTLSPSTELYMLKKQLRLERHRLLRLARINAPILVASKTYANSAGAALRHRAMRIKDKPYNFTKTTGSTCVYMIPNANPDGSSKRCPEIALPRCFHCREHVCENKEQNVFQHCGNKCGKSLSMVEAIAFDKLCASCHREKEAQARVEAAEAEAAAASAAAAAQRVSESMHTVHSSSASGMFMNDGILTNPSEAVYSDVLMGIHDSDANDEVLDVVVRNLGFDDRDITEMLAELPVDDDVGELGNDPYMDLGSHENCSQDHDWCDVKDFLESEGFGLGSL